MRASALGTVDISLDCHKFVITNLKIPTAEVLWEGLCGASHAVATRA